MEIDREGNVTAYDLFVAVVAIVALAVVITREMVTDGTQIADLLDIFDLFFCTVFFADFVRNTIRAKDRRRYLMTWGIFDLISSIPAVGVLRVFRFARVIRVLRALRSIRILIRVGRQNRAASVVVAALTVTMTLFVGVCVAVLYFEQDAPGSNIRAADDVLWWAVVTSSTVGYGDRYPVTDVGRVLGALLMFVGIGLFATASGSIGGMLVQSLRAQLHTDVEVESEIRELRGAVERIEQALGVKEGEDSEPDGPSGPSG